MQRGRLPKARARGGVFFKVGLTSVREELSIDLLERLLVDHAAGALLWEGTESAGVSAGRGDWARPWGLGFLPTSGGQGLPCLPGGQLGSSPRLRTEVALQNDETVSENGHSGEERVWTSA